MGKEVLVPFGNLTTPAQDRLIARAEGINPFEIFYERELERLREEGYYLMFFCAPLKASVQKSVQLHSLEALEAASQILGTSWNGKNVSLWIPHLHALPIFNEEMFPQLRDVALSFNLLLLRNRLFDGLLIFGDRISSGMKNEIIVARDIGMEILNFDYFLEFAEDKPTEKVAIHYFEHLRSISDSNLRRISFP